MKRIPVTLFVPEVFGLAIVGAAIGAILFGSGAEGVTKAVLIGGAIGACAASLIFVALRVLGADKP